MLQVDGFYCDRDFVDLMNHVPVLLLEHAPRRELARRERNIWKSCIEKQEYASPLNSYNQLITFFF